MIQVLVSAEQMKLCERCNAVIFFTGGPLNPKELTCNPNTFYVGCRFYSLQYFICAMVLILCEACFVFVSIMGSFCLLFSVKRYFLILILGLYCNFNLYFLFYPRETSNHLVEANGDPLKNT